MNDLYLEIAQTSIGKSFFSALNLPQPPELNRSPDTTLRPPKGRVLVAGSKNSYALKAITASLSHDDIKLCTPVFDNGDEKYFSVHARASQAQQPEAILIKEDSNYRFKTFVLDVTGLKAVAELSVLHTFFQKIMLSIQAKAKIVVVSRLDDDKASPEQLLLSEGVGGFVRSLAKEIAFKGATCNWIRVQPGAEKHIQASLFYFTTDKSSFVTGQCLDLQKPASRASKFESEKPLKHKVALVTGAAQGIGEQVAKSLARDGASVICLDIPANESLTTKLANSIGGHALSLDLSEANAVQELQQTIASQLGALDIIVHNAGITRDKTLKNMPSTFWDQVMDINLNKIIEINRKLLEAGTFRSKARIVCVSSISGIAGNFGQTNYATSKAAIAGYVEHLAPTLEQGITINAVAPGFIETAMTKKIPTVARQVARRSNSLKQGGLPIDVAEAINLFCQPSAQALNGNVLRVCGQNLIGR